MNSLSTTVQPSSPAASSAIREPPEAYCRETVMTDKGFELGEEVGPACSAAPSETLSERRLLLRCQPGVAEFV